MKELISSQSTSLDETSRLEASLSDDSLSSDDSPKKLPTQASTAGMELSPPHTWSESEERSDQQNEDKDNRHLFTVRIDMPDGIIQEARITSELIGTEHLHTGMSLFPLLDGIAPSHLLTVAQFTHKQRIFSRLKCGPIVAACELLCQFEGRHSVSITALAIRPACSPSAPFLPISFMTRHSAACTVTHIDNSSIPYLGHLPSDILGRSLLSFIYAPDVHIVRQAHFDLFNSRGKVVRSMSPLRLVAHNGALLTSETQWSAYVNPWTKRMEMIVALHRIVDAPVGDANVLADPLPNQPANTLPPQLAKGFEDELRSLMSTPVPSSSRSSGGSSHPSAALGNVRNHHHHHHHHNHHHQSTAVTATVGLQKNTSTDITYDHQHTDSINNQNQHILHLTTAAPALHTPALPSNPQAPHGAIVAAAAAGRISTIFHQTSRPVDLGAYIDKIVETLVVNGQQQPAVVQSLQNQSSILASTSSDRPQQPRFIAGTTKEEANVMGACDLPLSYTQINCLENVHRLLKSQSRPESPIRNDASSCTSKEESQRSSSASIPLTREALMQHNKRWEEEYRDTWNRRLKRMSSELLPGSPLAKHARPSSSSTPPTHWPVAQREEYYRSLAPNPPPPPGKNYEITSVPLGQSDSYTLTAVPATSAFTAVLPKAVPLRDLPQPIALTIQDQPSVIQTNAEPLMIALPPAGRLLYACRHSSINGTASATTATVASNSTNGTSTTASSSKLLKAAVFTTPASHLTSMNTNSPMMLHETV